MKKLEINVIIAPSTERMGCSLKVNCRQGRRELKAKVFRELRLTARELRAYGSRELNCFQRKQFVVEEYINNSLTQGIALQFTNAKRSIH